MVSLLGAVIPTPHTITVELPLDDGPDGPRWGTPATWQGRWENHTQYRRLQLEDGRVVEVRARGYLPAAAEPVPGSRITFQGETFWVRRVDTPVWTDGTVMHHEVEMS